VGAAHLSFLKIEQIFNGVQAFHNKRQRIAAMAVLDKEADLQWDNATSLKSVEALKQNCPQGSFVRDNHQNCDQIAVIYNKGQTPPHITVKKVSSSVQTVWADGVAVAVVACTSRPTLRPDDVLLIERSI
jgi:hypothetical protein